MLLTTADAPLPSLGSLLMVQDVVNSRTTPTNTAPHIVACVQYAVRGPRHATPCFLPLLLVTLIEGWQAGCCLHLRAMMRGGDGWSCLSFLPTHTPRPLQDTARTAEHILAELAKTRCTAELLQPGELVSGMLLQVGQSSVAWV